jgi:hypothetical protein
LNFNRGEVKDTREKIFQHIVSSNRLARATFIFGNLQHPNVSARENEKGGMTQKDV